MPADTPTKRIVHENGIDATTSSAENTRRSSRSPTSAASRCTSGARARQNPRKPDWVCFDLDPDSGKFADAARAGLKVKEALDALGLVSFAKTSGKKGMHVFVPDPSSVRTPTRCATSRIASAPPRGRVPEGADRGVAHRGAQGTRLPGPVPQRLRADRRVALLRPPLRPEPPSRRRSTGTRSTRARARQLQPRQLRKAPRRPDPWKAFWKSRQKLDGALAAVRAL